MKGGIFGGADKISCMYVEIPPKGIWVIVVVTINAHSHSHNLSMLIYNRKRQHYVPLNIMNL